VSICDLAGEGMPETVRMCEAAGLPQGLRVTTHIADVSDFAQMERFRAEVADRHATDRIHLLFNNAGIGGGSSLIEPSIGQRFGGNGSSEHRQRVITHFKVDPFTHGDIRWPLWRSCLFL
jgi:NAD(P)-dependent dehydrogenase (short-subunit alcohol dehydrogenase family)